jgi:diguanylate cyclase (GGDEF)-like protein/PAS domain S-box-containing protein
LSGKTSRRTILRAKAANLRSLSLRGQSALSELDELRRNLQDLEDANEALSQASHRFQHLFQEIPNPTFSFDTNGTILEWNRAFAIHQKIVGLARIRPVWELVARPGEWARSRQMFDRILRGELIDGLECECRLANGSVAPVLYNAFPLQMPSGEVVGGIGTYLDISDLKRSEQEKTDHTNQQLAVMELGQLALSGAPLHNLVDEASRFVRETLNTTFSLVWELVDGGPELLALAGHGWPEGILGSRFVDDSGSGRRHEERLNAWRAALASPAGGTLAPSEASGYSPESFTMRRAVDMPYQVVPLVSGDLESERRFAGFSMLDQHEVVSGLAVCIYEGTNVYGVIGAYSTTQRTFSSQEIRFLQAISTTIASSLQRHRAARQIEDYMAVLEEQKAQLEQANARLEMLATVDGLTGLKNHRFFQEQLSIEFQQAHRTHQPLGLILVDVDHFKRYNDSFGHPEGDEVLRMVALILRRECRAHDIVARYGGEEFVLVLPETDEETAAEIAERIRRAIEQEPWTKSPITASFGVASNGGRIRDANRLIAEADHALYSSKNNGRNCITVAQPGRLRVA